MGIDASIVELGSRLDDWFQDSRGTFASEDRMAQGHALVSGFDLVKELDRLKSEGTAALTSCSAMTIWYRPMNAPHR